MEIGVVAVGKLRSYYRDAADDYIRRLKRYVTVREHEVREASRAVSTPAQLAEEAKRLTHGTAPGSTVIALTRQGSGWSSRDLAARLGDWLLAARPVTFILGGSNGLDPMLVAHAGSRWSLGPLTLPHELARVVVLEQLYRGFTILRGEAYHKGV